MLYSFVIFLPHIRYSISDLLLQRLTLTKLPKDIILNKILLPLCIQLGLRGKSSHVPRLVFTEQVNSLVNILKSSDIT